MILLEENFPSSLIKIFTSVYYFFLLINKMYENSTAKFKYILLNEKHFNNIRIMKNYIFTFTLM